MKTAKKPADVPGVIEPHTLYTLGEFQRRAGLGKHAMRNARAKGLKVRRPGRAAFVLGADWIAFVLAHDADAIPTAAAA